MCSNSSGLSSGCATNRHRPNSGSLGMFVKEHGADNFIITTVRVGEGKRKREKGREKGDREWKGAEPRGQDQGVRNKKVNRHS